MFCTIVNPVSYRNLFSNYTSQTLRDAVIVCREMNVRYLWIDALCIVQNDVDEQDWYTESGRMRHVYSNALFAISADVSTNSNEGFLREQYNRPRWRTVSGIKDKIKPQAAFFRPTTSFKHKDPDVLLSSALSKRGWALQESILPNRIIHFTNEELIWECNTHCQCQCGKSDYSLVKLTCCGILKARTRPRAHQHSYDDEGESRHINDFLSNRTLEPVFWAWQTIVEYYTQRQLTKHFDKLSALSGLAQVAMDCHGFGGGAYLAGLWWGSLVDGLLWHVRGPTEPRRYSTYCAPSWSWASIDGGVKYFTEKYQFRFIENVVILEASCEASPSDPTGRVKSGHLVLSGRLLPVKLIVTSTPSVYGHASMYTGYSGHAGHTHKGQIVYVQTGQDQAIYEILLDERMEDEKCDSAYYCLEVATNYDPRRRRARVWWLVLREQHGVAEEDPVRLFKTFERVGIGYKQIDSELSCGLFSHSGKKVIKLI